MPSLCGEFWGKREKWKKAESSEVQFNFKTAYAAFLGEYPFDWVSFLLTKQAIAVYKINLIKNSFSIAVKVKDADPRKRVHLDS